MPRRKTTNGNNERCKARLSPFLWIAIVLRDTKLERKCDKLYHTYCEECWDMKEGHEIV